MDKVIANNTIVNNKVIEVCNLSFGYNGKLLFKDLSFSVKRGDFVGIVGPNGAGKSTLVKLLLKILTPASGKIRILGEEIETFDKWDRIGYISQKANSFNISFPATVEEIVGANLYSKVGIFKPMKKEHKEQIYNALKVVDMENYRYKLIGNLSGGQQQRVFIARVLVSQPEVMFLDEPTAGIDAKTEEAVYCLLARLNKEMGITIIMITHDISAVTVHANKLACMGYNKLFIHDRKEGMTQEFLSELYGYDVNLHIHRHDCKNCNRKEVE